MILKLKREIARTVLFALVLVVGASSAYAAPLIGVEVDPYTFVESGGALHLKLRPSGTSPWEFGVGTYSMDFPEMFVNMNPANAEEGWSVRLDRGVGLFLDYDFRMSRSEGVFAGVQVATHTFSVEKNGESGEFTNLLIMPGVGTVWRPLHNGLYLRPWFGVGWTAKLSGATTVGGDTYDVLPILPFGALHIGYTFGE